MAATARRLSDAGAQHAVNRQPQRVGHVPPPLQRLTELSVVLQQHARAPASEPKRASRFRRWQSFLHHYSISLGPGGATDQLVAVYITYLDLDEAINSGNTIDQYIYGGPREQQRRLGLPWTPLLERTQTQAARNAARRFLAAGTNTNRKAGVTIQHLASMSGLVGQHTARGACLWAAFLVAFYGLLRKSNVALGKTVLTPALPPDFRQPGKAPNPVVRRGDITKRADGSYLLTLPCTKTRQPGSGRPQLKIPLPRIGTDCNGDHRLCPSAALDRYLARTVGGRPATDPLFGWVDTMSGSWVPLSHAAFVSAFKTLLRQIGEDPTKFGGQSFRRGGASFAHNSANLPKLYIKALGDWLSDAFEVYVEADDHLRDTAQKTVGAAIRRLLPA